MPVEDNVQDVTAQEEAAKPCVGPESDRVGRVRGGRQRDWPSVEGHRLHDAVGSEPKAERSARDLLRQVDAELCAEIVGGGRWGVSQPGA